MMLLRLKFLFIYFFFHSIIKIVLLCFSELIRVGVGYDVVTERNSEIQTFLKIIVYWSKSEKTDRLLHRYENRLVYELTAVQLRT
jgi:hypothetical protein